MRRTTASISILKGSATLIRLPKLAATLEELKPGAQVHVHINDLDYIDHACLDLLTNWDRQHNATGGSLTIEWDELSRKYHQRRASNMKAARRQGQLPLPAAKSLAARHPALERGSTAVECCSRPAG